MTRRRAGLRMALIVAVVSMAAVMAAFARLHRSGESFDDSFDANIQQSQPVIGSIVEADPTLRALYLRRTSVAYAQGGWPAAIRMFDELTNAEINAYAGDRETLNAAAAWHDVLTGLRDKPTVCRAYLDRHFDDPAVQSATASARATSNLMTVDGGRRRLTQSKPDVLDDAEFRSTYSGLLSGLTQPEKATLTDATSDDAAYCQASIKLSEAAMRLPPGLAARYARSQYRATGLITSDAPRPPAELPAGLHCAPPGTLFTLNMQGSDGLPITWESLGQSGWDCRIRSSGSGERGLWGNDRRNPLRLMGTLAIGQTTRTTTLLSGGVEQTSNWRVTGFQVFWLPWGTVGAYTLEEDVTEGEGRHYVVTHDWSPDLGFKIGQHVVAKQGSLPEWLSPDWQLIGMEAPGTATARGAVLAKSAAAAEIRYAMQRAEAIHPDLFWYADRSSVLAREDAVVQALPDPATAMDVYLALSDIIGLLGDGHIYLSHPAGRRGDVLTTYRKTGGKLLLVAVKPTPKGLQIQRNTADGLVAGDSLTTINGQDAQALFWRAAKLTGGEPNFQQHKAEDNFPSLLWDLGLQPPFRLTGVFGGLPGQLEVPGQPSIPSSTASMVPDDQGIRSKNLPNGVIELVFDRMTAPSSVFHARLQALFTEVAQAQPAGLVIDLRRNGGGDPALGNDLLDFITDKPYRAYASVDRRASPECRTYFTNLYGRDSAPSQGIAEIADGTTRHADIPLAAPGPNPLRFAGPVAVLIGPGTFSAADILASSISDFQLATLVGQDTAEIPTNFGSDCPIRLPLSGIVLKVPSSHTLRASGDTSNHDDVHPDIHVPRSDDDSATDVDITAARRWITSKADRSATR